MALKETLLLLSCGSVLSSESVFFPVGFVFPIDWFKVVISVVEEVLVADAVVEVIVDTDVREDENVIRELMSANL